MANAPSNASGIIAGTPVEISAGRPDDGGARILSDHQAVERRTPVCAVERQTRFYEKWRAVIMYAVDRDGATWRQWYALRADRLALVRQSSDTEEYIGPIARAYLCGLGWMRDHPIPN